MKGGRTREGHLYATYGKAVGCSAGHLVDVSTVQHLFGGVLLVDEYYCVNKNCNVSQLQNSIENIVQEYDRAVSVNLEVNCQDFVELAVYRLSCDCLRYNSRRCHKEEKI